MHSIQGSCFQEGGTSQSNASQDQEEEVFGPTQRTKMRKITHFDLHSINNKNLVHLHIILPSFNTNLNPIF